MIDIDNDALYGMQLELGKIRRVLQEQSTVIPATNWKCFELWIGEKGGKNEKEIPILGWRIYGEIISSREDKYVTGAELLVWDEEFQGTSLELLRCGNNTFVIIPPGENLDAAKRKQAFDRIRDDMKRSKKVA